MSVERRAKAALHKPSSEGLVGASVFPTPVNNTTAGSAEGLLLGGNANNGANAGFVYAYSNNVPSNTNANIGSRNCLMEVAPSAKIWHCGHGSCRNI